MIVGLGLVGLLVFVYVVFEGIKMFVIDSVGFGG